MSSSRSPSSAVRQAPELIPRPLALPDMCTQIYNYRCAAGFELNITFIGYLLCQCQSFCPLETGNSTPSTWHVRGREKMSQRFAYYRDSVKRTALMDAAEDNDLSKCIALISAGADVDGRDEKGATALLLAADFGHWEVLKLLVESGADVNLAAEDGESPLMFAVTHYESTCLLLEHGADVNARTKYGNTVLIWAISLCASKETVDLLLESGANPMELDKEGTPCLVLAAGSHRPLLVEAILERHPEIIDCRDAKGRTALIQATISEAIECIKALITYGADISLKDIDGRTCFDHVQNVHILKLLEESK